MDLDLYLHFARGLYTLGPPISDQDLYIRFARGLYTLGVYSLGPPISHFVLSALGLFSLGPPISDLVLYMPVLKKNHRGPFNVPLFKETHKPKTTNSSN